MATTTKTRAKTTGKAKTSKRKAAPKRKTTANRKTTAKGKATSKSSANKGLECPITQAEFREVAERLHVQIMSWGDGAAKYDLDPREFSSGSFGWFASEKLEVPVGGKRVRCQMSINVTVIGSKNSK